jgi:hypothetical protein
VVCLLLGGWRVASRECKEAGCLKRLPPTLPEFNMCSLDVVEVRGSLAFHAYWRQES